MTDITLNTADCIRTAQGIFTERVHNVCTGTVVEIPRAALDYLMMGFSAAVIVVISIAFTNILWSARRARW